MELPKSDIHTQTGSVLKESYFGIGNVGLIIQMLRDKMYSNPILSLVREVASNARDAHTEVGKKDHPIQIHVPHIFDAHLKIKDWGPGISPDRMENVFIQFANSTKRDDNSQIGGFGLGSKSPFSYSNQFSIITTTPETNGSHTKRTYLAFIDETQTGKLTLVREEPTSDPCGTEIVVPVQKQDFPLFVTAIQEATFYWEVQPIIVGDKDKVVYPPKGPSIKGTGWELFLEAHKESKAIIDGIAYPIDAYALDDGRSSRILYHGLCFYFNVGELTLVPSREHLQYDENTKKKILDRIAILKQEFAKHFEDQVENAPSYIEAAEMVSLSLNNYYDILHNVKNSWTWKGHTIYHRIPYGGKRYYTSDDGTRYTEDTTPGFIRCYTEEYSYAAGSNNLVGRITSQLLIKSNMATVINDTGKTRIPKDKIKSLLNDDIRSVQVITFAGPAADGLQLLKDRPIENIDLTLLNPIYLSTIPSEEKPKVKKPRKPRVFQIYQWKGYRWEPVPKTKADLKNFTLGPVIQLTGRYKVAMHKGRAWAASEFELLTKQLNITIYGVMEKDFKFLTGHTLLTSLVESKIKDLKQAEPDFKYCPHAQSYIIKQKWGRYQAEHLQALPIDDPNSLFLSYIKLSKEVEEQQGANYQKYCLLSLLETVETQKEEEAEIAKVYHKVSETYPLLPLLDSYRMYQDLTAVAQYINLVDQQQSTNKS